MAADESKSPNARAAPGSRWARPHAERLHYASKLADRTTVYTHRDPEKVIAAWSGKRIHQIEQITVQSFDPGHGVSAGLRDHQKWMEKNRPQSSAPPAGQYFR